MHRSPRSEINVTPLVDVVLVLLIVFMVASPLATRGYVARLPDASSSESKPVAAPDTIVVSMTGGAVYLNREKIDATTLGIRLRSILREDDPRTVFFSAADAVGYRDAMDVMDTIRSSGARHIGLVMSAPEVLPPG